MKKKPAQKYYAVRIGRRPGIYTDYHETIVQTQRYPNSEYRAFTTYEAAVQYLSYPAEAKSQITQADILIQFDGGSRGNPGKAGSGVVVYDQHHNSWTGYKYLGEKSTNNEAEYEGLIIGLTYALHQNFQNYTIEIQGDSKLVINHMLQIWACKEPRLQRKREEAQKLMSNFSQITLTWIPREKNQVADRLSNDAMDKEETCTPYTIKMQQHAC